MHIILALTFLCTFAHSIENATNIRQCDEESQADKPAQIIRVNPMGNEGDLVGFIEKPKGVSGEVTYSLLQSDWMNAWRKSADEPIRKQQLFALSNTTELHLAFGDLLERMDFEKIYDQLQQLSVIATTSESGTECIFTIGIHVFSPYFIYETAFAPDPALNGPYTFRVDCPRPGAYVGVVGDDWQRLLEEIVYTINGSSADSFRMNSTSSELFLADDLDRLVEKGSQHVLGVLAHWPEETDATSTINVTVGHCGKAPDAGDAGVAEHEALTPTETADVVWIPIPTDAEMAPMPTPAEEDALPFTTAAEPTTPETPIETTMPHLDAPVTDRPIHIARLRTVLITAKCPSRGDVIETLPRRFRVDQEEGAGYFRVNANNGIEAMRDDIPAGLRYQIQGITTTSCGCVIFPYHIKIRVAACGFFDNVFNLLGF